MLNSSITRDESSVSQWHRDYLNGMSAQEWCEYGLKLNAGWSNQKVIRKNGFKNNSDLDLPQKLFLKLSKSALRDYEKERLRRNSLSKVPDCLRGPILK